MVAETYDPLLNVLPSGMALEPNETRARLALFGRLLGSYPVATSQDLELTVEVYLEMTADVPFRFLSVAVGRLMLDPETRFAPRVGEVRQRSALEVCRSWRQVLKKDPDRQDDGKPVVVPGRAVDFWITKARQLEGLPEIPAPSSTIAQLPEGWEDRLKAIGEGKDA